MTSTAFINATIAPQTDFPDGYFEWYIDTTNHATDYMTVLSSATLVPGAQGHQVVFSGLDYNTTYYIWSRYKRASGSFGSWSGPASVSTGPAPSTLNAIAPLLIDAGDISLQLNSLQLSTNSSDELAIIDVSESLITDLNDLVTAFNNALL